MVIDKQNIEYVFQKYVNCRKIEWNEIIKEFNIKKEYENFLSRRIKKKEVDIDILEEFFILCILGKAYGIDSFYHADKNIKWGIYFSDKYREIYDLKSLRGIY